MRLSNFKVICFIAFSCLCYPLLGQFEKSDLELVELRDELEGIGSELAQLRQDLTTKTVEKRISNILRKTRPETYRCVSVSLI